MQPLVGSASRATALPLEARAPSRPGPLEVGFGAGAAPPSRKPRESGLTGRSEVGRAQSVSRRQSAPSAAECLAPDNRTHGAICSPREDVQIFTISTGLSTGASAPYASEFHRRSACSSIPRANSSIFAVTAISSMLIRFRNSTAPLWKSRT